MRRKSSLFKDLGHVLFIEEGYRRSARAIVRAHELGYSVSLISSSPPKYVSPYLSSFRIADPFCVEDNVNAAHHINSNTPISGVVTMMERLPVVASIASAFNLPGLTKRAAYISQNKYLCRKILHDAGIAQPRFIQLKDKFGSKEVGRAVRKIGFPCVIKPVGGAGGGGVFVLRLESEVGTAIKLLRRMAAQHPKTFGYFQNDMILEEYILGRQFSLECFESSGRVELIAVTEKVLERDKIEAAHIVPANIFEQEFVAAKNFVAKLVSAVGISDSVLHIEAALSTSGWQLIEINARLGGGCICTDLVPIAYGYDMVEAMCNIATGRSTRSRTLETGVVAAATLFRGSIIGHIDSIDGISEALAAPGVVDVVIESGIEEVLDCNYLPSDDRLGAVITSGTSAKSCIASGRFAASLIQPAIRGSG